MGHRLLLDAGRDDDAGIRRHHVHQRYRPVVQHRRTHVGGRALRIVSRITHERNVEAIHRAGADFVLSYATLGVESVMSLLRGYELVVLGQGVELFSVAVPPALAGRRLADSGIGWGLA